MKHVSSRRQSDTGREPIPPHSAPCDPHHQEGILLVGSWPVTVGGVLPNDEQALQKMDSYTRLLGGESDKFS